MTDRQLGLFYALFGLMAFVLVLIFAQLSSTPMGAVDYAHKLCQEIYGPQTQATWVADRLMCETARGEILPVKRPI